MSDMYSRVVERRLADCDGCGKELKTVRDSNLGLLDIGKSTELIKKAAWMVVIGPNGGKRLACSKSCAAVARKEKFTFGMRNAPLTLRNLVAKAADSITGGG